MHTMMASSGIKATNPPLFIYFMPRSNRNQQPGESGMIEAKIANPSALYKTSFKLQWWPRTLIFLPQRRQVMMKVFFSPGKNRTVSVVLLTASFHDVVIEL